MGTRNVREGTSCPRKEAARRHWPCEWEQGGTEDTIRSEGNVSLHHDTGSSLGKWGEGKELCVSQRQSGMNPKLSYILRLLCPVNVTK